MDIIVTPASDSQTVWSLTDRLGRMVGQITRSFEGQFSVVSAGTSTDPLSAMNTTHKSLSAAMDAIALHLKGVCQLASGHDQ